MSTHGARTVDVRNGLPATKRGHHSPDDLRPDRKLGLHIRQADQALNQDRQRGIPAAQIGEESFVAEAPPALDLIVRLHEVLKKLTCMTSKAAGGSVTSKRSALSLAWKIENWIA